MKRLRHLQPLGSKDISLKGIKCQIPARRKLATMVLIFDHVPAFAVCDE